MRCFIKYYLKSNILAYSAQCAFYFLLSLFPFLFLATNAAILFSISNDALLDAIRYAFPKNVYNLVLYNFHTLQASGNNKTLIFYIFLSMWSSSMFIGALKFALRQNVQKSTEKSFVYYRLLSVIITVIFAVLISSTFYVTLLVNVLLGYLKLDGFGNILTKSISFCAVIIDLILLYMFLPPKRLKFKEAIPGAVFSASGVLASSGGFSFYINNIANPTKLYGTLGSVVMLMIWLFICSFILITGGLINNYLQLYKTSKNL